MIWFLYSDVGSNTKWIVKTNPIQSFIKNYNSRMWMITYWVHVSLTFEGLHYIAQEIDTKIVSEDPFLLIVMAKKINDTYTNPKWRNEDDESMCRDKKLYGRQNVLYVWTLDTIPIILAVDQYFETWWKFVICFLDMEVTFFLWKYVQSKICWNRYNCRMLSKENLEAFLGTT